MKTFHKIERTLIEENTEHKDIEMYPGNMRISLPLHSFLLLVAYQKSIQSLHVTSSAVFISHLSPLHFVGHATSKIHIEG